MTDVEMAAILERRNAAGAAITRLDYMLGMLADGPEHDRQMAEAIVSIVAALQPAIRDTSILLDEVARLRAEVTELQRSIDMRDDPPEFDG